MTKASSTSGPKKDNWQWGQRDGGAGSHKYQIYVEKTYWRGHFAFSWVTHTPQNSVCKYDSTDIFKTLFKNCKLSNNRIGCVSHLGLLVL